MRAPRSSRALVSPSAQRMASTRLLLPLPLGPTIAVIPGSSPTSLRLANVLNPEMTTRRSLIRSIVRAGRRSHQHVGSKGARTTTSTTHDVAPPPPEPRPRPPRWPRRALPDRVAAPARAPRGGAHDDVGGGAQRSQQSAPHSLGRLRDGAARRGGVAVSARAGGGSGSAATSATRRRTRAGSVAAPRAASRAAPAARAAALAESC